MHTITAQHSISILPTLAYHKNSWKLQLLISKEEISQILELKSQIGIGHCRESDSTNGKVGIIIVLLTKNK